MNQRILKEITTLERVLSTKLLKYQVEDEEESKETYLINQALSQLRQQLNTVVERVISTLEKESIQRVFPLSKSQTQIEKIQLQLQYMKALWERKAQDLISSQQRREAQNSLSQLQEFIEDLRPSKRLAINSSTLFNYNADQIYNLILSSIQSFKEQEVLLDARGIINLKTKVSQNFKNKIALPQNHASFFLQKLYICGGSNASGELDSLLSLDSHQHLAVHANMSQKRRSLSLSGIEDELIAVGGYRSKFLSTVQLYNIPQDQWKKLPGLKAAVCLLKDLVIASQDSVIISLSQAHSKDQLQVHKPGFFKKHLLIQLNTEHKLTLFGGIHKPLMLEFSLDGKLTQNLSHLAQIPKHMGQGSFIVKNEGIVVSSGDPFKKWRVQVFQGEKWGPL